MIIRCTIRDNDFTHIFKDFCIDGKYYTEKRSGFNLLDNLFKTGDYFTDLGKEVQEKRQHFLGNVHKKWKKSDPDYHLLIDEIYRQWDIFAKDHNFESWLRPTISIQNQLTEKDENGEVCYYFTAIGQCLIM